MKCQKFYKMVNGKELLEIRVLSDEDEEKNRESIQRLKNSYVHSNKIKISAYTSFPTRAERESQRDRSISPPIIGMGPAMGAMSTTPTRIGRLDSQEQ